MKNPIIVALDLSDGRDAIKLVDRLKDEVGLFKIGLQLFSAAGPDFVREVRLAGGEVFLDLKLHDIPNTVAQAVREAMKLDVGMMTIHTSGGSAMMKAAARAMEAGEQEGRRRPLLLGVTVLTSLDEPSLKETGVSRALGDQVAHLAGLAADAGLGGVVASPKELPILRARHVNLTLVTPGIRPAGSSQDDQARVTTPRQAIEAGADFLVIGRPLTKAEDPVLAARAIRQELGDKIS